MPNHHHDELAALRNADHRREIEALREDTARVLYALDCALQLVECLIAFTPEGVVLPEGVATCKYRLDEAMKKLGRK